MNLKIKPNNNLNEELDQANEKIRKLEELNRLYKEKIIKLNHFVEKVESAIEGANDGLWDWNLLTNETYISKPWKSMLGYEENEINDVLGEWERLVHPDDLVMARQKLTDYIQGKASKYEAVFRMRHKDNSYQWVHSKGKVVLDENGKPCRISGSHTNITMQKKAEERLQKALEKYKNLYENSMVGIFRSDFKTGYVLEANTKAWDIFGMHPVPRVNILDFYVDAKDKKRVLKKIFLEGEISGFEAQMKKMDDSVIWVLFSCKYFPNEDLIEGVVQDITDYKENLNELQKVNYELDNFVYHSSHDLRSPLRSILGLINLIKQESSIENIYECAEKIERSINRLDVLVLDLLNISRNNRMELEFKMIDFKNEIDQCKDNISHLDGFGKIEINTTITQEMSFFSDITRIKVMLNNLISNSVKYHNTANGPSFINININTTVKEATITIVDNGIGISKKDQEHVFEMFFRASESSDGSGLGLYIVKNVVNKLSGTIKLESAEGVGTTFIVILPNQLPV